MEAPETKLCQWRQVKEEEEEKRGGGDERNAVNTDRWQSSEGPFWGLVG